MKKALAIFAIVALASCGGGTSSETTNGTDSTKKSCDTTCVKKDSTGVKDTTVVADTTKK